MIRNMLAIDDSAAMREMLAATLRAAGYEVTVAAGDEGLSSALAGRFDLVLTDQYMPKRSGLDVIAALRLQPAYAATPRLVRTTQDGVASKDAARAAGPIMS